MAGNPWCRYSRGPRRPGLTPALGQLDVRKALVAAGLTVDWLSLGYGDERFWQGQQPVRLLALRRTGDAVRRSWGDWPLAYQTHLSVSACPSEVRAQVRPALLADGLPRVLEWLAAVPAKGTAWAASERQVEVLWGGAGHLRYVEDRFR